MVATISTILYCHYTSVINIISFSLTHCWRTSHLCTWWGWYDYTAGGNRLHNLYFHIRLYLQVHKNFIGTSVLINEVKCTMCNEGSSVVIVCSHSRPFCVPFLN